MFMKKFNWDHRRLMYGGKQHKQCKKLTKSLPLQKVGVGFASNLIFIKLLIRLQKHVAHKKLVINQRSILISKPKYNFNDSV